MLSLIARGDELFIHCFRVLNGKVSLSHAEKFARETFFYALVAPVGPGFYHVRR